MKNSCYAVTNIYCRIKFILYFTSEYIHIYYKPAGYIKKGKLKLYLL